VHQQLGALVLGTTPTNGQTITFDINGTNVQFQAVTGTPTNPGDVKAPGTAAGFVANLFAALQNPTVTTSTYVALSAANAQLIQYLGFGLAIGGTTITPFSLNTSTYSPLSSFSASTTVTSGTWTAQTMELYVQPGTYYVGTTRVLFLGGSTPTFTAPVSHPRIDLVTADSTGTIALVTGTENVSPSAPAYPANKIVLAEIYNVVGETGLYDVDNQQSGQGYVYNDVRPFFPGGYISSLSQVASGLFIIDPGSEAQGDILYYSGSAWVRLPAGASGQVLNTQGPGANPIWAVGTTMFVSSYGAGNIYADTTMATTASTSLVKVREIQFPSSMPATTLTINALFNNGASGITATAWFYLNGVAQGSANTTSTTPPGANKSMTPLTLTFNPGDKVQIYASTSNASFPTLAGSISISGVLIPTYYQLADNL
jgi:hypothetical protein